jgi:hypothetical protein
VIIVSKIALKISQFVVRRLDPVPVIRHDALEDGIGEARKREGSHVAVLR